MKEASKVHKVSTTMCIFMVVKLALLVLLGGHELRRIPHRNKSSTWWWWGALGEILWLVLSRQVSALVTLDRVWGFLSNREGAAVFGGSLVSLK